jgi:hypothetical protein
MPPRDYVDFIEDNPHPGNDPAARLRHTLDRYPEVDDDRIAVQVTTGIYPEGPTGLTFGDLRAIARMIGA